VVSPPVAQRAPARSLRRGGRVGEENGGARQSKRPRWGAPESSSTTWRCRRRSRPQWLSGHADLSKRKARRKGGAVTTFHAELSFRELRHGGRRRRRPIWPPHLQVWLKDGTARKSKVGRRLGRDESRGGAAVARSCYRGDGATAQLLALARRGERGRGERE
jgi:hypothetical protein